MSVSVSVTDPEREKKADLALTRSISRLASHQSLINIINTLILARC